MTLDLLIATSNPHKLDEIRAILAPRSIRALALSDITLPDGRPADSLPEPEENADTFAGNARLKAVYYARATRRPCLADDSGLEVDALAGAPGVRSARYADSGAGAGATRAQRDAANNDKLLRALAETPDDRRAARFVCAMCLAAPDGAVLAESRGEFAGRIGREPRGSNGFGYDPLLVLPDGRTSAELPPGEKNARSHRAAACRALAPRLATILAAVPQP